MGNARKILFSLFLPFLVLASAFFMPRECEALADAEMARVLADKLGAEFSPESLFVTVRDSHAYAEARGIVLSGVRVDALRLEAILTASELPESDDVESLASMIGYSWGEVTLLEGDVNSYFSSHETRGFSGLSVTFNPDGFFAKATFSTSWLFTLRIRLSARGAFALRPDGVYIDNAEIYVEGVRQPSFIVEQVMERANPLIRWDEIPFRIVFRDISINGEAATMTGYPAMFEGGSTAYWNNP
ncbi:MAG: hypothetical protein LBQ36_09485 [Synergistaceae bacterium]|jgi:Zn-dependent protease with chaperone function|nr:hypothetical protein [Synergistaceae bacterium]